MDSARIAARLTSWAGDAGFDWADVVELEPARTGDELVRWVDEGRHASMSYMAERQEVRADPRRVARGARSALCVARRYGPLVDEPDRPLSDFWQGVARYARGVDYHDTMERDLRVLGQRIETYFPGAVLKTYVDTGPVLERALAESAGLGAVGKNTCLIRRDGGSYFFLGEIVLTLELGRSGPPAPATDVCGRCTACLEACPTDAFVEPFVLDARKCISYWTIEHRGPIPVEHRAGVGAWVFGCDICQEVCPWNGRRATPVERPESTVPHDAAALDLLGILALGEEAFRARFAGTPIRRAGYEGVRRNAVVVMGNRGDESHREALERVAADDPSPTVREHAAWALARLDRRPASIESGDDDGEP